MEYTCAACGERHEGFSGLGATAALYHYSVPEEVSVKYLLVLFSTATLLTVTADPRTH
jgi:hypothetical protein